LQPTHSVAHVIFDLLPTIDFTEIQVAPNEFASSEISVDGLGRFDVFLTAKYSERFGSTGKLNVVFELKVEGLPSPEQSKKYADWLERTHPDDTNLLVYFTPFLRATAKETVGDHRWYCLNYQLLNDKLLTPLLEHPNLNEKVRPFLINTSKISKQDTKESRWLSPKKKNEWQSPSTTSTATCSIQSTMRCCPLGRLNTVPPS